VSPYEAATQDPEWQALTQQLCTLGPGEDSLTADERLVTRIALIQEKARIERRYEQAMI
jgi:hypothetical protein